MEEKIFINVTEEERYIVCFKQVPQTIIKSNENLKVQMYTYVSFLLFLLFWVGGKKNDSNLKSGKIPCIFIKLCMMLK